MHCLVYRERQIDFDREMLAVIYFSFDGRLEPLGIGGDLSVGATFVHYADDTMPSRVQKNFKEDCTLDTIQEYLGLEWRDLVEHITMRKFRDNRSKFKVSSC